MIFCWIYLADMKKYDHEYVSNLFRRSDLAEIMPQLNQGSDILKAISDSLKIDIDEIPYKVIEQIDLILNSAIEHGILIYNPLELYVKAYARRATERQRDVRNALVKNIFRLTKSIKFSKKLSNKGTLTGRAFLNAHKTACS